nr:hypothetical protein [Tanacetum cinerariifolium]GEX85560.1 hypothetical protein [Tanacetum cinerariifolium]
MGNEHLSTILETESDEVIKSSVENLVPIPSESEGIFDNKCDVPFYDNSPPLDVLTDHFELFFNFNDDCTSSDDDYFEDIDYVEASPFDSELVSLEEVQDDILSEKLLNINLLIAKIESLNDNSISNCVLESPSLFHILVEDNDSWRTPTLLSLTQIILYRNLRLLAIIRKRRVVAVSLLMLITLFSTGSESRPPMLNKENYVPWSSRLLQYAKSRPNGKLIHNSILNGPYVRRMISEPGDGERDVNVNESFHEQADDELSERELKQIEVDDQAIQTILLGLPED